MEDKKWCVYEHINLKNNKKYIGLTSNTKKRWGNNGEGYLHKNKKGEYSQPFFANAIIKYGWDCFEHKIIIENLSKEEAELKEKELIILNKTYNPEYGYNLYVGSCGSNCMSEESKKKLSNSLKESGKFLGENNPFFGKTHSEETKKIIGQKNKEHSKKRDISGKNNPMYGFTKEKMTEEQRYNRGKATRGKHREESTKKKISESNKEYYKTHKHHALGTKWSDERREKFMKTISEKKKVN